MIINFIITIVSIVTLSWILQLSYYLYFEPEEFLGQMDENHILPQDVWITFFIVYGIFSLTIVLT